MEEMLTFLNHWWREGKVRRDLAREYKRIPFEELKALLEKRQIIVIYGLRRVGKSTLMYQLIQYLIEKGIPPSHILGRRYSFFD